MEFILQPRTHNMIPGVIGDGCLPLICCFFLIVVCSRVATFLPPYHAIFLIIHILIDTYSYYVIVCYCMYYASVCVIYIYIYIYYVCMCVYIYIYIYIYTHTTHTHTLAHTYEETYDEMEKRMYKEDSPSHRRGSLKGVPTVKSLLSHV